jgi:hypothetical protein
MNVNISCLTPLLLFRASVGVGAEIDPSKIQNIISWWSRAIQGK